MKIRKESMRQAFEYYLGNEEILIADCAKRFNVDRGTLGEHLRKAEVNTNRRKAEFNENFFETIDTEEKAYWLGFVLADGSIDDKKNALSIGVAAIDGEHLINFKDALKSNHNIYSYLSNNNVQHKKYPTCDLVLCSKKIVSDLSNYGIVANKSKCETPYYGLRNDLVRHYIRGFYDGDGWISSYDRRIQDRCKNQKWEIGFGSSKEMLNYTVEQLANLADVHLGTVRPYSSFYRTRTSSQQEILKFIDFIYKDSTVYLTRKYSKALEFCRLYSNPQKSVDD